LFIPKETIELVRDRADIETIIRKYVPSLSKRGQNLVGLCPFHKEKTPSFTVNPEKNIFHCFGCQTGGNVFTFISKIERLDFPDSVKFVADIVGIEIESQYAPEAGKTDVLYKINEYAMNVYHAYLKSADGKTGYDYLTGRGLTRETIESFGLGFAPDSWDFLKGSLSRKDIDLHRAAEIGLIKKSDRSDGYYDYFRNRIIFPIIDQRKKVRAFGARVINDSEKAAKYLNSPESDIYQKRDILFGINMAIDHIRDVKRAIIVEGYLDVIGCHQAGIRNVVAPLGTAFTAGQAEYLSRFCTEVVLLFDSDSAGINAALKALEVTDTVNLEVKIGVLSEGDPFDCVMEHGPKHLMAVVDSAIAPVDFKISRITENLDKKNMVNKILQLFSVINSLRYETEKTSYLKKISSLLELDEKSLRSDFKNYRDKTLTQENIKSISGPERAAVEKSDFITRGYRDLIRLLIDHPDLIERAVIDFSISDINDETVKGVFKKITEMFHADEGFTVERVYDRFAPGPELDLFNSLIMKDLKCDDPGSAYTEIYINMKIHMLDKKIKTCSDLTEIEILKREREKLSSYMYNSFSS